MKTAERYLDLACKKIPVLKRAITEHGDCPLSDYLKNFVLKARPSYQQQDDFLDVMQQYVTPLMGESAAWQAVCDLGACPVILTANHLGVEYFSQSLQSSLLFSLNSAAANSSATTVPVFSFGNIPLNNLTYPRGVLLYHVMSAELNHMPVKLPIFPDRLKRQITGITDAFNHDMIQRAEARLDKMVRDKQISHTLADTMRDIFQKDYCSDSVIYLPDYAHQSAVLNRRIWKRLFSEGISSPELIYFEIEKIVSLLLEYDLPNPKSLVRHVMFDPDIRERVIENLDGLSGCWTRKELAQRLNTESSVNIRRHSPKNHGTLFFWGVDDSGRKIPFSLESDKRNHLVLKGRDDRGKIWKLGFTPRALVQKLQEKQLIPSLFTCFLTLSFARGLICIGGYFQGEYLPAMQRGVVTALQKTSDCHDIAHLVAQIPTDCYLSGMLGIMSRTDDNHLIPAGAAEIIAGGGISGEDIEQMLLLTVREAHIAGLFETLPDVIPRNSRETSWKKALAADCSKLLKEKIVVKKIEN
ncbi:hypothetical protein [Desulfonema magnum]|uniref:Uncharacterized protein n=1 Tax=Desulfonema magnum TaxID=45655 RepID=A0A975GNZ5_9BACT|nr:hypothetical protein [Desulfonema magnum]QTA88481.1 Uncharacterized protein dnm_045270 [Desulfonema magnum]